MVHIVQTGQKVLIVAKGRGEHYILQHGIDSEQFSAVHATSKSGLQFSLKLYKQTDFITLIRHLVDNIVNKMKAAQALL